MTPRHALAAIAVAVIWGANFVVIDAGLHDMPPLTFVALRFVAGPGAGDLLRQASGRPLARHPAHRPVPQPGTVRPALPVAGPRDAPGPRLARRQVQVIFTVVIAALALHERPTSASSSASSSGWSA
jgi:O-acetylserine/cysteine efflux transporter